MRSCRSLCALALAGLLVGATAGAARAEEAPAPKARLYVFFATWCVPCRAEIPHVQRLHETYASQGLAVTLVSEDAPSTVATVPAFLARFDITAPWVIDNESALIERYNPSANVPFTAIVDANGKLVYAHAGYEPGDERLIEEAVVKALAAAPSDPEQANSFAWVQSSTQGLGVWRKSRFDNVNDGRLRAAVGRVEVTGHTEAVDVGVRVDGALVDDNVAADDAEENDARLERAYAAYDFGAVKLRAGDDYVAFGHGVTLSLRKVDPLGVDTSLQGGRVDASYEFVKVTGIAGWTNPQNIDPIELRIVDDVHDVIAGSEVRFDLGDAGSLAPYVFYARAEDAAPDGMSDVTWTVGGASTSLVFGDLRISAEGAAGERGGVAVSGDETSWAGYAAVQLATGPVTTLIDAKAYRHWEIGRGSGSADGRTLLYHEPPTLEREDQEVPGNEDAVGARVRVEYRLPFAATVFGNALYYRYAEDGGDPLDRDVAVHGYIGGEKRFANGVNTSLQAGYRKEWAKNLFSDELEDKLNLWHVDVDASVPLARRLAATAKWNHRSEEKRSGLEFVRGLAVIGLSIPGVGAASFLYGYSTEEQPTPTHYPAGELLYHLPKGGSARLFYGRLTGGRVCVSGSCRDVPPFEGARLDLILHL